MRRRVRLRRQGRIARNVMNLPSSEEFKRQISALEEELAAHEERAREAVSELAALDEKRFEIEGRLALAQRAQADHHRLLDEHRAALLEAELQEVQAALTEAVNQRDAAAVAVAGLFKRALEGLAELDRLRETVLAAARTVSERASAPSIPAEPEVLDEQWARTVDAVRTTIGEQLDDEAVEAAARSAGGRAMEELPPHLYELARQRRQAFLREVLAEGDSEAVN
jgi:septation ring formation regulator EzrA